MVFRRLTPPPAAQTLSGFVVFTFASKHYAFGSFYQCIISLKGKINASGKTCLPVALCPRELRNAYTFLSETFSKNPYPGQGNVRRIQNRLTGITTEGSCISLS
jgi:hypothetical protein